MSTLYPPNIRYIHNTQHSTFLSQGTNKLLVPFTPGSSPTTASSVSDYIANDHQLPSLRDVFVRDPPRAFLNATDSVTRDVSSLDWLCSSSVFDTVTSDVCLSTPLYIVHSSSHSFLKVQPQMAKSRRSLQSILVPSFLHSPPPSTLPSPTLPSSRTRSFSSSSHFLYPPPSSASSQNLPVASFASHPPPDLLDDDPFANLSGPRASRASQPDFSPPPPPESIPVTPRSPLSTQSRDSQSRLRSNTTIHSSPPQIETFSRPPLVKPAHKKPAFAPRPSLPSLHTLAQMKVSVVTPKKVRKGHVGARLPFEPWDLPHEDPNSSASSRENSSSSLPSRPDFTFDLDMDFLDFSDDSDEDESCTVQVPSSDHDATVVHAQTSEVAALSPNDASHIPSPANATQPPSPSSPTTGASRSFDDLLTDELNISSLLRRDSSRRSNDSQDSGQASFRSSSSDSDAPNSPPDHYLTFPRRSAPSFDFDFEDHLDYPQLDESYTDPTTACFSHNSLQPPETSFEPSSSGTIRGSYLHMLARHDSRPSHRWVDEDDDLMDGSDWRGGRSEQPYSSSRDGGGGGASRSTGSRTNGAGYSASSGGAGSGAGGDDGDDRHYRNRPAFPLSSSLSTESESESESDDDSGLPSAGKPPASEVATTSDDDIPLAQRIPTALKAQKTIRKRFREEREQRRKDRADRAEPSEARSLPERLAGPRASEAQNMRSSSREAAMLAAPADRRARTYSPSPARPSPVREAFTAEELTKRLQNVQTPEARLRSQSTRRPASSGTGADKQRGPHALDAAPHGLQTPEARLRSQSTRRPSSSGTGADKQRGQHSSDTISHNMDPSRVLRPHRSFHRPAAQSAVDYTVPMPANSATKLGRSATDARSRQREDKEGPDMKEFDRLAKTRRSADSPSQQHLSVPRPTVDVRSSRSSVERDLPSPTRSSSNRPHNVPPASLGGRVELTQQRVFVGDMQRFNTVEISPATTARDVLEMVEAQGTLKQFIGSGGWMVFEVAQDFGMERPIRNFELISDIQASWNTNKLVNTFVLKMTPLASVLSRSAIPSSSPMFSGWIDWESKRGKWSKRWMSLREHSLWISKRDSGKDEVFLCSLSNFDAYFVTRAHKAPKPFVFGVKSTDNLSFFESTDDYMHLFSCNQQAGEKWVEAILLARSYVLYQEKNVLYNPKSTSAPSGGGLSRSGTRKTHRPNQPLVNVAPQEMFEPGSLLYKSQDASRGHVNGR